MANYSNNLGQIRLGWRTAVSTTPVNTNDVDATAFITAAGITDSTQISALNTLVNDLKTYGLWTKMKALYPFVGGSAASHKWNLKDPRDLDAAYRLVFNGGLTHNSNGMLGSINGYSDTKLNDNILLSNSAHFSIYSTTNIDGLYCDGGTLSSGGYEINIFSKYQNIFYPRNQAGNNGISNTSTSAGLFITNRVSSTEVRAFQNNSLKQISSAFVGKANLNIYLSALNNTLNGIQYNSIRNYAFSSIGDGLSDTEASNFYTSVQKFQTTLGRHVGTPYVSDPDAIAFLMAAGITDGTQAAAINTLVIRMKADGVWTKMKAIYPFVGGSAASHKFNLKDPRDLDAAYRLVFNGGWTHTGTGAKPNGTTGYANTYLNPYTVFANRQLYVSSTTTNTFVHISKYSRTNNIPLNGYDGVYSHGGNQARFMTLGWSSTYGPIDGSAILNGWGLDTPYSSVTLGNNTDGFFVVNRNGFSSLKSYRNNTLISTNTTDIRQYWNSTTQTNMIPDQVFFIGARNDAYDLNLRPFAYNNFETSFQSIGIGLTDGEATNLYTAVQEYQTTLGRQVNIPLVSDTDAQAFLNAANITSFQQASAVNKLVVDLKAAGIWTKMKAIYPFIGGSATSHKFNLKDPRDLDAAYRLVFNGGWTHTGTGALPNGTTGYADTKLSPISALTIANHFSFYNNGTISNTQTTIDIGSGNGDPNAGELYLWTYREDGTMKYDNGSSVTNRVSASTTSKGFSLGTRTSNTSQKIYKNGNLLATNTNVNVNSLPYPNIYIGGGNINGTSQYPSSKQTAFASIGDGLTDGEATSLYTAVQTYQTSLGRSVDTPVYNNGLVLNLDAGNANSYPGTGTTWFDLASGKNSTLVNGPVYNSNNGGYLTLDGVNDRVDTTYTPGTFTNQTIIAWINKTNTQYCFILQKNSSPPFGFEIYPTTIYVCYGAFEAYTGYNPTGWHQVAYVYDGTQTGNSNRVKVYVNGILQNLTFGSNPPSSITINDVMQVGWRPWASLYSAVGISTLQMYNTSLSSTEILNNFNSTRGRFGI